MTTSTVQTPEHLLEKSWATDTPAIPFSADANELPGTTDGVTAVSDPARVRRRQLLARRRPCLRMQSDGDWPEHLVSRAAAGTEGATVCQIAGAASTDRRLQDREAEPDARRVRVHTGSKLALARTPLRGAKSNPSRMGPAVSRRGFVGPLGGTG
jgi:hypothetical protein